MRQSRYSDSQIMTILKLNERGVSVYDLCREHGMSTAMFYKRPLNPLLIDSVKNGGITLRACRIELSQESPQSNL